MHYYPNFPAGTEALPDTWAAAKEAEGWQGICASDHLWVGDTRYPHPFVAATQMACATTSINITTSFCNNLFRSPIEFALAALSLQSASQGRFEAGLGAGWAQDEIEALGWNFPDGPTRVSMYVEAMQIVRALLHTGQCRFDGEFYQIDIQGDRALRRDFPEPPPLIGAAGGPRALREVSPLVDRMEVKASARATRGGSLDFATMSEVSENEVRDNVERVRSLGREIPLSIFILVGTGDNPAVQTLKKQMGNGYLSRFVGSPSAVAQALGELGEMGIDRVQLTELVPGSHSQLAPILVRSAI